MLKTIIGKVPEIVAAIFITLFLYTAIKKFTDHHSFEWALRKSPLLRGGSRWLAFLVPSAELIIVGLLIIPASRYAGLAASFVLMSLFTLYIGYMLLFTPHLPCSCGGILKELSWRAHLKVNIALTILAGLAICIKRPKKL